ncbi:ABC transporter permease [Faecalicatena sp. AGMB00832]|uniref:ABC transporter permease n=1 Tax=Faecalicatena faecalis TaxID=2726362 RepID=A0ABS6D6N6_9FIRM|nr:ABC transporter permease [Faecalicatena faecalis]MBU3877258.1 ABC transporter permease [Faecalicatena faecalis]
MLGKLALRNARRSMRDYSVYLLTVTIAFSLMYAFNMVAFSKDIRSLGVMMDGLSMMIGFISIIVVGVTEWLVHYMNRFMLEKRSKELGTYMLLGISNRKISRLVLFENVIMGAAALLAGLVVGSFLYQILNMIIKNIFEVKYSVQTEFSLQAFLLTLLYVVLIYAFSVLRMRRRLKKVKIYDLIYAEKQNETAVISKKKGHLVWSGLSFLALLLGCGCLYTIFNWIELLNPLLLIAGLALLIAGLYGVYITLGAVLVKVFLDKKERKYTGDNLFIYRNLSAKMKTMSVTIGTLAMLLMLTLACIQSASLFNTFFERSALNRCTFDAQISSRDDEIFGEVLEYFQKTRGIKESLQVSVLNCGQKALYHTLEQDSYGEEDYAIAYSDYARLRKMLGYEPVKLKKEHYILHAYPQVKTVADTKKSLPYTVNGITLERQAAYDEPLSQGGTIGVGYIIVLPDETARELPQAYTTLVMDTKAETTTEDYEYLLNYVGNVTSADLREVLSTDTKGRALDNSRGAIIMLGFSLYYAGLIFICTAATILTVQQLSEASKHRFRYSILSKLGVTERKISRLILRQLVLYFGIPVLLPVPLSIFISLCVRKILMDIITPMMFWESILMGLGMFFLIYVLYFAATYAGYRRSILD